MTIGSSALLSFSCMNHECWLSAIVPRRAPSCEPNHQVGNIAASKPDVSARCFPIAASTFLLEGKKGSQARVWYKVMCRRYSYRLSRKRLVLVCFIASSRRTPFVPIHGMSYPRGDTFLIPALHPVPRFSMSEKRRRCIHTLYTHCSRSET